MASVSAREILAHHTLLCSIKMPIDLFSPNAKVQTSIYLFRAHIPHDFQKNVLFVDFRGREPSIDALLRHLGLSQEAA
mgnify:CR=1 FL=1